MITSGNNAIQNGQVVDVEELIGKSTDTKPTNVGNGSVFLEMDTSKIYIFDAEDSAWLELGATDSATDDATDGD